MTMRELLKFELTCDGFRPDGRKCPCGMRLEAFSREDAAAEAGAIGWRQDYRGWICNAGDGHRDDRQAAAVTARQNHPGV